MDADGSSSDDCRREVLICMSGGFLLLLEFSNLANDFRMKRDDGLTFGPFEVAVFAARGGAYPGLGFAQPFADLHLRKADRAYLSDK